MNLRIVAEGLVTVRTVFGKVEHATILRRQLGTVPLAARGRIRTEVHHYIEDGTAGAARELCFRSWVHLVMQPADRAATQATPHVRLHRLEVYAMIGELPRAPRAKESPTVIVVKCRCDEPHTRNRARGKLHRC